MMIQSVRFSNTPKTPSFTPALTRIHVHPDTLTPDQRIFLERLSQVNSNAVKQTAEGWELTLTPCQASLYEAKGK
ncbi:MAG: hypothetical protein U0003_01035 [Vampirovibrionales bacterium]